MKNNAMIENMKQIFAQFKDTFEYDATQKTAISVRDGIIEYYGSEIGMLPADKLFRVYRSPATIANAAQAMLGIPITNDHVSVDMPVVAPIGTVNSSYMIDLKSDEYSSTVGILNTLELKSDHLGLLVTGKRELSLGYCGTLLEMPPEFEYDFEQRDIEPHHLAIVEAGRCGSVCSFIDHSKNEKGIDMSKKNKLNKAFCDAEGMPSLAGIVEIVNALPDAIAALPLDQAQEVMPVLQGIVAKNNGGTSTDAPVTDAEGEEVEEELNDEAPVEEEMKDTAAEEEKKAFGDAKKFQDAVNLTVKKHLEIIDHARKFLPETYNFKDKSATQIMCDAVAVEYGKQKFSDTELSVAFKMLKKANTSYSNFGDNVATQGKFSSYLKSK